MTVSARTFMYEAAVVILHRIKRPLHLKDWAVAIEQRSGPGKARVALARKLCRSFCTAFGDPGSRFWAPPTMPA
jgi:transposase